MHRRQRTVLSSMVLVLIFFASSARADDNDKAIEAITKLGGTFERDEAAEGKPVVKVDLGGTKANDATLKLLAKLPNLIQLDLEETLITNAGLKLLATLPALRQVNLAGTKLADTGIRDLQNARQQLQIGRTASLRRLEARAASVQRAGTGSPARRGVKINIETEGNGGETRVTDVTLAVDTPDFSERELQLIVERVPEISRVVMSHQIETFTSRGLAPLKRLPKLRHFYIGLSPISNDTILTLQAVKSLTSVDLSQARPSGTAQVLNLAPPRITDAAFANVAKSWPNLEEFEFSDFGVMREPSGRIVTGTGLTNATIVSLSRCPKLRRIVITSAPQITDAALPALAGLQNLQEIWFVGCERITDASVPVIGSIMTLKKVYVVESGFSPAGIAQLQQALPNAKIN